MRTRTVLSMLMMTVLIGVCAGADDKKAPPPIDWSTTMPSIELSHQPLEKVLEEMKTKLPGFDFSISRENVPHDQPVLPEMTVENVSLAQFAALLNQEVPGLQINGLTPRNSNNLFGNTNGEEARFWHVDVVAAPDTRIVHVFTLSEIVAYRASLIKGDGDHEKQATNDILSLIQTALDEVDSPVKASLKVHHPTETLICKVTPYQATVIGEILQNLTPTEAERGLLADVKLSNEQEILSVENQLDVARSTNAADSPIIKELEMKLKRLTQSPTTQP